MAGVADRDLRLLHDLQQRRLDLGRRPVDLVGQEEVAEHRAQLGVEGAVPIPTERWFPASEGLKTVRALLAHLQEKPDSVAQTSFVRADLEQIAKILDAVDKRRVRFHFSMDQP